VLFPRYNGYEDIGINRRKQTNRIYKKLRERIKDMCHEFPLSGEVEVDESYFGARRIRGKRGRGAYGKTIVFGDIGEEREGVHGDSA